MATVLQTLTNQLNDELISALTMRRVYLACSGGRDSLALAQAFWLSYTQHKIPALPTLVHVHHGWQIANDAWADMVSKWADERGFECKVLYVKLDDKSETSARKARYLALSSIMATDDILVLGHHANDQAETMLMRLADGAGVAGLSAMKRWSSRQIDGKSIRLWRPWLSLTRDEITVFADEQGLDYVDDMTNEDPCHARGLIRTQVLPQLTKLNPKAVQNMVRSSQLLGDVSEVIDDVVAYHLKQCIDEGLVDDGVSVLDVDGLLGLSSALQALVIRSWLTESTTLPPAWRLVQDVLKLATRTQHDHKTELFWQSDQDAYIICRYRHKLYRYQQDAWRYLHSTRSADGRAWRANRSLWQWDMPASSPNQPSNTAQNPKLCYHMPSILQAQKVSIVPYARHQKITLSTAKTLHGKRLVQTLGIAPWLREHLWLVMIDAQAVLLLGMSQAWRLRSVWADEIGDGDLHGVVMMY